MPHFEDDAFHPRFRCECCGYRTRPAWETARGEHDQDATAACLLCDWENAPANEKGIIETPSESAEDRNDGYSLAQAKANFAQFGSMYDPAKLEPWMLGPPSAGEMELRHLLRAAYDEVEKDPKSLLLWDDVVEIEEELRRTSRRRLDEAHEDIGGWQPDEE